MRDALRQLEIAIDTVRIIRIHNVLRVVARAPCCVRMCSRMHIRPWSDTIARSHVHSEKVRASLCICAYVYSLRMNVDASMLYIAADPRLHMQS